MSTDNINRVPEGVPTGGQFAAGARSEPDLTPTARINSDVASLMPQSTIAKREVRRQVADSRAFREAQDDLRSVVAGISRRYPDAVSVTVVEEEDNRRGSIYYFDAVRDEHGHPIATDPSSLGNDIYGTASDDDLPDDMSDEVSDILGDLRSDQAPRLLRARGSDPHGGRVHEIDFERVRNTPLEAETIPVEPGDFGGELPSGTVAVEPKWGTGREYDAVTAIGAHRERRTLLLAEHPGMREKLGRLSAQASERGDLPPGR